MLSKAAAVAAIEADREARRAMGEGAVEALEAGIDARERPTFAQLVAGTARHAPYHVRAHFPGVRQGCAQYRYSAPVETGAPVSRRWMPAVHTTRRRPPPHGDPLRHRSTPH